MQKKHRKIAKKSLLYTPVGIGLLVILLIYMVYTTYGVFEKWSDAHGKLVEAENAYTATVARHEAISSDLNALSTERGKEEIIREKFQVVKEGEGVVVLPGDTSLGQTDSATVTKNKKTFWTMLKEIFKKAE